MSRPVLDGASIEVAAGEIVALLWAADFARSKILELLVVLPDQKSPIIAVRLAFIWRMPE